MDIKKLGKVIDSVDWRWRGVLDSLGYAITGDLFQRHAHETAVYPKEYDLEYCGLKLAGEAGEIAQHIGKRLRDDGCILTQDRRKKIIQELGDVLWYVAEIATILGVSLDDIMVANLYTLRDRQERGVLKGDGDNR